MFGSAYISPDAIRPCGRREEIEGGPFAQFPIFQGEINSCVTCAFSFINQYFSWKQTGEMPVLSWPYLFKISNPSALGTKPRIVADNLRKRGEPSGVYYSLEDFLQDKTPDESDDNNALDYRIKNYSFLADRSIGSLYRALRAGPLAIGVGVNPADWRGDEPVIVQANRPQFYHMIVLVDVTENGNLVCVNWWRNNELDIRILDLFYPIEMAISFEDLPDGMKVKEARTGFWESLKVNYCPL